MKYHIKNLVFTAQYRSDDPGREKLQNDANKKQLIVFKVCTLSRSCLKKKHFSMRHVGRGHN